MSKKLKPIKNRLAGGSDKTAPNDSSKRTANTFNGFNIKEITIQYAIQQPACAGCPTPALARAWYRGGSCDDAAKLLQREAAGGHAEALT
jgi:hypothetical protein